MSQFISLQQAIDMTTLYRQEKENIMAEKFKGQNILARCETFDRDVIDSMLAQPGCKGLRIYYGMSNDLKIHAIGVGVNDKNEDMLPLQSGNLTDGGYLWDDGRRCPEDCPAPSALNP